MSSNPTRRQFLRQIGAATVGGAALPTLWWSAACRGREELASGEAKPVVVVGCGGIGTIAATELVTRGIPVLSLDGGPLLDAEDAETWPAGVPDEPYRTSGEGFSWARLRMVGGKLTRWQGHCPRFSPANFREGGEISPDLVWPVGYDDLAPFYVRAERLLGVTGRAAGIADLPDGEYPAALADRPIDLHLRGLLDELGVRLTPGRFALYPGAAVSSELGARPVRRDRAAEDELDVFDSLDHVRTTLLAHPRFALVPEATVTRIEHGPSTDDALVVTWRDADSGRETSVRARNVVLAAGCLESTKILLDSTSERFPDGLGNASGVLGRYLTDHPQSFVVYRFPREVVERDVPPGDDLPNDGRHGSYLHCGQPVLRDVWPELHGPFAFQVKMMGRRSRRIALGGMCRVDSRASNRIRLTGERTKSGLAIPEIHFAFSDDDRRRTARMIAAGHALAERAGGELFDDTWSAEPGATIHYAGTCRMGADPATSMLDGFCESHEVGGLFVVDGGAFVTNPEKNPTLTMAALALRACGRVAARLG